MTFNDILNVISDPTQAIKVTMMWHGAEFSAENTAEYFLQISDKESPGLGAKRVVTIRTEDEYEALVVELR